MLTLIYLRHAVLLSKRPYGDWREIREQFEDFKTSLGPFGIDELFDFLHDEYPRGLFDRHEVEAFLASDAELMSGASAT